MFCTFGTITVILAWTDRELSCGQSRDWPTHRRKHTGTHTHTQTQAITIPKCQSWTREKNVKNYRILTSVMGIHRSLVDTNKMCQWSGKRFICHDVMGIQVTLITVMPTLLQYYDFPNQHLVNIPNCLASATPLIACQRQMWKTSWCNSNDRGRCKIYASSETDR